MRLLVRDPTGRLEKVIKTHDILTHLQRVYKTNGISTFPMLAGWAGCAGWLPLAGWLAGLAGWLGWLADWLTG